MADGYDMAVANKKALNRIKFHSWKIFMCLILFTYDDEILVYVRWPSICMFMSTSICKCHSFEFTTDLRKRTDSNESGHYKRWNRREWVRLKVYLKLDSSARTHTYRVRNEKMVNNEVTIVMACNGLMTLSKGLQQLSCYSKRLLEGGME